MSNLVAALLLASVAVLDFGGAPATADTLKCEPRKGGDPGMPEIALIIDHKSFEGDPSQWNYEDYDIHWVQIVCWSWIEGYFGIEVRVGATYVLTEGWVERMHKGRIASLEALIAAQDRHREAHGAYAGELDNLSGFGALSDHGLPEYVQLDLLPTENGWGARVEGTERWLAGFGEGPPPIPPCYAFVGTPPDQWEAIGPEDRGTLMERQPVCLDPYAEEEAGSEGG